MSRAPELNYCPTCGHALQDRRAFGRVRRYCATCDQIIFHEHKIAAGVLVEPRHRDGTERGNQRQVLLVRRRLQPRQGTWTFPAGFVDFDENPAQAAVRECLEETGLEVEITSLLDVIAGREHEHGADILIIYCGRWIDGELRAADDVDRAAFFPLDSLPPLAFRATQIALDKWRNSRTGGIQSIRYVGAAEVTPSESNLPP